jgi:hypothetical protein
MNPSLALRLTLDVLAGTALLVALAYYWLDNTAHEVIGTGMFLLLVAHGTFHRRWFGTVTSRQRERAGRLNLALTLLLLVAMLLLLISGLYISRTVLGSMALTDVVMARQVHTMAAHWVVLLVAVHIGMRWTIVMGALRRSLRLKASSRTRTVVLRVLALGLALDGVRASFEMLVGSKLLLLPVLDLWDFDASTPRFFWNYIAIIGLYAALMHYAKQWMERGMRGGTVVPSHNAISPHGSIAHSSASPSAAVIVQRVR